MAGPEAYHGAASNGISYVRIGESGPPLVVFDEMKLEHKPVEGLVLQGLVEMYEDYADGFTVFVLEPPREMPLDYGLSDIASDYASALEELVSEPVTVMGLGFGGMVALRFALLYQERLNGLVLVAAAHRLTEAAAELAEQWIGWAQELDWGRVHESMIRNVFANRVVGRFYGWLVRLAPALLGTPEYPWDFVVSLRAQLSEELDSELSKIGTPVLCVAGEKDFYYGREDVERMVELLPNAELELFPAQGHGVIRSRKRRIRELVSSFAATSHSRDEPDPRD
jgi:pimeloyl-ACP methyl ester carboxylesterase